MCGDWNGCRKELAGAEGEFESGWVSDSGVEDNGENTGKRGWQKSSVLD